MKRLSLLNMKNPVLKDTLIGEEWMALRQIALGEMAAAIPHDRFGRGWKAWTSFQETITASLY
jgi:hypothetical protein